MTKWGLSQGSMVGLTEKLINVIHHINRIKEKTMWSSK